MISFIWLNLFKLRRKFYRLASPFLCYLYSFSNSVTIRKSLLIGFPYLSGKVTIKEGSVLVSLLNGNELGILAPCRIIAKNGCINIGKNFQASGVCIFSNSSVTIGDNVLVGANCLIVDDDMHPLLHSDRLLYPFKSATKPIYIGDDVWIGANVTLLKGVTIGDKSVIGSGVVVRSDVPPGTVLYYSNSILNFKPIIP